MFKLGSPDQDSGSAATPTTLVSHDVALPMPGAAPPLHAERRRRAASG